MPGIVFKADGTVIVDAGMMTGHAGIFAGGDMVPSERTVTAAVGHGKKAARHIDAWLRGEASQAIAKHPVVTFDQLQTADLYRRAAFAPERADSGGAARPRIRGDHIRPERG